MSLHTEAIKNKSTKQLHHPWESVIKNIHINNFQHAHNSVNNPQYPKKKKEVPYEDRVAFTIIGNRVTKEFIYCEKIVKGLHKYRRNMFDAPVIRGVTTVDWPKIWNDLKLQYGGLAYCLESQVAVILNDKFIGGDKELRELIESRYHYHQIINYYKEGIDNFVQFLRTSQVYCITTNPEYVELVYTTSNTEPTFGYSLVGASVYFLPQGLWLLATSLHHRQLTYNGFSTTISIRVFYFILQRACVYMHISIDSEYSGTLIFMLYTDLVPYTCENFLRLCHTKRGGYKGTPIHRIVKDGWIQCGGFGLKSTDLDCENFIVPHDRRGVLCMANDGRHKDCSTQFFVLLQPAPWMDHKYVAFGQLIDGEATLKDIEQVPTFYESPQRYILIDDADILNLECHDIRINKGANEYIHGHIENLNFLGEWLYENLLEKVYLNLEIKLIAEEGVEEDTEGSYSDHKNIRATERFIRKKEEIEKLEKSQLTTSRASSTVTEVQQVNNDFDVEEYEYEPEEFSYQHVALKTESLVVKPEKPFYIPLTDVPYPGEVDSTYDLLKFLKGDYCLESDLLQSHLKKQVAKNLSWVSEMYQFDKDSNNDSVESLSEDDEQEIKRYIKLNVDRVSFAGDVIRGIARGFGKYNIFEDTRGSDLITDEELRRFRIASMDQRSREANDKKVSLSLSASKKEPNKIKRRQTGFVRMEDIHKIHLKYKTSFSDIPEPEEDDNCARKVRIADSAIATQTGMRPNRRQTGFVRPSELSESDTEVRRQSALTRLYNNITFENESAVTLKDYKPMPKISQKNYLLTQSPLSRMKYEGDYSKDTHFRPSVTVENNSFEQVLNLQHGRKAARKISSDYVKTIDQIEHKVENSLRSIEFAKTRPSMSVSEYQQKNIQRMLETNKAEDARPSM